MNTFSKSIRAKRATGATLAIAVAAFGAMTVNTFAQDTLQTNRARVVFSQTNRIRATVEAIDHAKREITLKGPKGHTIQFMVGDSVKNFPQIKKGDEVNIGYYESVALALGKPGEILPPTGRSETVVTRGRGQRPGGAAVSVTDITATVEDIDRDKREVTLLGPDGNEVMVMVDTSVGNLQNIKKGDQIAARRTEAMAISVDKPGSSSGATNSERK